eukprot:CCRYP_017865-RA/>CCRYP_017865-RA protein AED:0.47 eAED:0.43 QI:0/-1/0/1/-1/1/1/0/93
MYMKLPPGIETKHRISKDYALKILPNLYCQKQTGGVWNQYMVNKQREIKLPKKVFDKYVFYQDGIIFIVYVKNGLFFGSDDGSQDALGRWPQH